MRLSPDTKRVGTVVQGKGALVGNQSRTVSRRTLLQSSAAAAGMALLSSQLPASASGTASVGRPGKRFDPLRTVAVPDFPNRPGEVVLPWLDQRADNPVPEILGHQLKWEELDSWITPDPSFFTIHHYAQPEIDPSSWSLEISGLVKKPLTLTLADLKARQSVDVPFTLECSGNSGLPFLDAAVGNAVWTGTPLAPLLEAAGVLDEGTEVVFWGTDSGDEQLNDLQLTEHFARGMSLAEAMDPRNILCWGMNGDALPTHHGGPVRLIAPGWYGIANVKWLKRIELLSTPYEGRFMARDYVTIRQVEVDGATTAHFTLVGHALLKSAPAKVTVLDGQHRILGAAWGGSIASVDVKLDDGDWMPATIQERGDTDLTWVIWTFDWGTPSDGEHTVTSRATDMDGNVQPTMDDPLIANKLTYWESNGQITRHIMIGMPSTPQVSHTLSGAFLDYWQKNGGVTIFGNPITAEFDEQSLADGQTYRVQYLERHRFEMHPEKQSPYSILLGLLGNETIPADQKQPRSQPASGADNAWFEVTGHNISGRFLEYWKQNGGVAIFGYPITEEFQRQIGDTQMTVQYFERARMELHTENQRPYDVLLGLLGNEALQLRYNGHLPPEA